MMIAMIGLACTQPERVSVPAPVPEPELRPPASRRSKSPPRTAVARVRTVELGRSVSGKPIEMHIFGDAPRPAFIFGGIHGSEPTSAYVARKLVEYLHEHPEAYAGTSIAVLPAANPDGLKARTRRNARGVDLNRNFPARNWKRSRPTSASFGGSKAASEPETVVIMRAVRMLRPSCIVSIHSIARGKHCNNFDGPARTVAARMARENGYPVQPTMGYPTPGSFGSWAGVDQEIPTITLELPRDAPGPQAWKENQAALLAVLEAGTNRLAR